MILKNLGLLSLLPLLAVSAGAASLIVVNDNFNNGDFASVGGGDTGSGHAVFNNDSKTASETTVARWVPGTTAGGWQRTELHSNNEVPVASLLSTYSSVQYSWTITSVNTARRDAGTDAEYRIQLGILPATVTQGAGAEMYLNTQGGIWLDMNILGSNATGADVQLYDANVGKTANADGTSRTTLADPAGWNWANTARTFTLTLDRDGYTWSDSAGTNYGGSTYGASGLSPELLSQSFWGFSMGQDRAETGRGGHDLTNFSVVAIPETGSSLLTALAAGALLVRRRR